MNTYSATIRHHSIASARIETFEAATVAAAKRKASHFFGGEQSDFELLLWVGQPDDRWDAIDSGTAWRKRLGSSSWKQ